MSSRGIAGSVLIVTNTTALAALRTVNMSDVDTLAPRAKLRPLGLRERFATNGARPTEPLRSSVPPLSESEIVFPIALPVTTIGRAPENAVAIPDPSVSREHARMILEEDGWWIENVSVWNPLWVGGVEIAPGERTRIAPGQITRLGNTHLQLLAPPRSGLTEPRPGALDEQTSISGGWSSLGADGIGANQLNPLSPGVTLQFALRGRLSRSAQWTLLALALVVFIASAILTLDVAALAGEAALASGGLRQALTALAIPIAPALGVALVVGALDRYEREPLVTMIGAFLWGAVIAIPPTLFIEGELNHGLVALLGAVVGARGMALGLWQAAAQAASAGATEELVKGAGLLVLLLVLRDEFDNVTDGIVYGALIGAGFAMVENFVYFAVVPRAELGFLIVGRIALGWLSHSTFTALFGAGLGYIRETQDRRAKWLAPILGLLGAIALHSYFDFIAFSADLAAGAHGGRASALGLLGRLGRALPLATILADYGPLFLTELAILSLALAALRREAAIVRTYLVSEVLAGAVTPDEYLLAQNAPLRSRVEREYGLRFGLRTYLIARNLYQTATGLAFRKWHVAMGDPPKQSDRQPEDAYRERLSRLRRALMRQTVG